MCTSRFFLFAFWLAAAVFAQQPNAPTLSQATHPQDPVLKDRQAQQPNVLRIPEGQIKLDMVVTDAAGNRVTGLEPWDFKVVDNGQPRKVMSFRSFNGDTVKLDPPVEILLVIDTLNLPFQQVAFVRSEIEAFLKQNGGHLRQPLTLVLFSDSGMRMQPRPSVDGNALAEVVSQIKGGVNTISVAMGGEGHVERFQLSVRALANIAENEAKKPDRKLLIWVGPGWPMLNRPSDGYTDKEQRRNFDAIVELSRALREARIAVYSVSPTIGTASVGYTFLYQNFLKGVRSYHEAESGNLALKVIAKQTGGLIFGPDNDLASQINRCIDDANVFYRISFNPPVADHADEYHELKVQVDRPGLAVRTNTGYYNQPTGN
jgi:VWFA-related protein